MNERKENKLLKSKEKISKELIEQEKEHFKNIETLNKKVSDLEANLNELSD